METYPKIPKATASRLPLYYRYILHLEDQGVSKFSSKELSEALDVDSATIRRDFSYFGELGKRGYGYDVKSVSEFFGKLLGEDRLMNIGVVGVGNLGSALVKFRFSAARSIRVSCAFDIKEDLVGRIVEGLPIYSMDDLATQIEQQRLEIVALTVPTEQAQKVADQLVDAGIKGILNFTPQLLQVPKSVQVQNVDLTGELQTLIYYVNQERSNQQK